MKCLVSFPNAAILTTSYRYKTLNRVQNVNRESALEPSASNNEERIPFTLTFYPNNLAARNVILRNFQFNSRVRSRNSTNFPNPPLVSFIRDRNLRNSLIRSSLPSNLEPGTFNCFRKCCNTCPLINSKTHIQGPKGSYQVKDHFDGTTSNIIYIASLVLSATYATLENQAVSECIPVLQRRKSGIPQPGCAILNHLSLPVIPIKNFFLPLNDLVSWHIFLCCSFILNFSSLACSAFLLTFPSLQPVVLPATACSVV